MPATATSKPPSRIYIGNPSPAVDGGRFPAKRCVGDTVPVGADIFRDGHDKLRAVVRWRGPGDAQWQESDLVEVDAHYKGVHWEGSFPVDRMGRWEFTFQAWTDVFATWRDELQRKVDSGQHDLSGELSEGVVLLEQAAARAPSPLIAETAHVLANPDVPENHKFAAALAPALLEAMEADPDRTGAGELDPPLRLDVDRVEARFAAWYELFPRSFGGLKGTEAVLPQIADLGFDVLYLPPIHPIGVKNRKGRNNTLAAEPGDPGSPWAIGHLGEGGHDAVHPELGTIDDLRSLCARAAELGLDVALDLAIQCSADHPWLTEHPEWFNHRPDGTLKYAENPPKRYQDIYNINWDTPEWEALWQELLRITLQWVDCGVRIFRVDNPHTKPFAFWEWLIGEVHKVDRGVLFLAEAFTRRAVMRHLAKIGFNESYTYFTWKTARWELTEYVSELALTDEAEYFRPNFFANTPDILHEHLQHGGPPAFAERLVLAATLSPTYGIYSGYEHFENVPVRAGSEEYLDSEKYETKQRRLDGPLLPLVQRLNQVRRANPALQRLDNVTFLETYNEGIIAYAKQADGNTVICAVCLDPHHGQEGSVVIPASLGLPPAFRVHDEIMDQWFDWRLGPNYVRLGPPMHMAHVLRVEGP